MKMQIVNYFPICCVATTVALLLSAHHAIGQRWIYFEGDKTVPFYVKVNDKMQQRFSKNYCIVANLKAGSYDIEILFEQNKFPPLRRTVSVSDTDAAGYLLMRLDSIFELRPFVNSYGKKTETNISRKP